MLAKCMDKCWWAYGSYLVYYMCACCMSCVADEGGLGHGPSLLKCVRTFCVGCWMMSRMLGLVLLNPIVSC